MNFNYKKILIVLVLFLFIPFISTAAGLVPDGCAGEARVEECGLNELFVLFANIGNFILGIAGSIALLMFIYGGFMFMFGGVANSVEKGKKILTGAVIGLIIILGAYLIVDMVLRALTTKGVSEYTGELQQIEAQAEGAADGEACEKNEECKSGFCALPGECPPENPKCGQCTTLGAECEEDSDCISTCKCVDKHCECPEEP